MRTLFLTLSLAATSAAQPVAAASDAGPAGVYEVVALRRASDVASGPGDAAADMALGRRARFGGNAEWIDGTTCKAWSLEPLADPALSADDPNLSDIELAPAGIADARENRSLRLMCDGRELTTLLQVDARVLVVPSASGSTNLVLERTPDARETAALQARLKAQGLLENATDGVMDAATRRALALYADDLGAAFAFERGVATENLLAALSQPMVDDDTLKIVVSGPISAHFRGAREQLAPLEYEVEELRFEFKGDAAKYVYKPAGTLHFSDWFFDVFSHDGSFVLLPQGHYGPYHVVRVQHLKDYLRGAREPDEIVGGRSGDNGAARVHGDAKWLSDTAFSYTTTCCGETTEHRHSIRFLDYRPKRTPDTVFDYRPALSLDAVSLPAFAAESMVELAAEMERLIAAARANPGKFEHGNIALGANPQEYVPSDAELLAARFGDAFVGLLNTMEASQIKASWTPPQEAGRTLIYHRFIYRHVDVMGSGRFFYASPPIPTVLELKPHGN